MPAEHGLRRSSRIAARRASTSTQTNGGSEAGSTESHGTYHFKGSYRVGNDRHPFTFAQLQAVLQHLDAGRANQSTRRVMYDPLTERQNADGADPGLPEDGLLMTLWTPTDLVTAAYPDFTRLVNRMEAQLLSSLRQAKVDQIKETVPAGSRNRASLITDAKKQDWDVRLDGWSNNYEWNPSALEVTPASS